MRRPSKKDGKLKLYWRTKFRVLLYNLDDRYVVGDGTLVANHRAMMHLLPILVKFDEWLESEPVAEGVIASIVIPPEDMVPKTRPALSRILQRLKDAYRETHSSV